MEMNIKARTGVKVAEKIIIFHYLFVTKENSGKITDVERRKENVGHLTLRFPILWGSLSDALIVTFLKELETFIIVCELLCPLCCLLDKVPECGFWGAVPNFKEQTAKLIRNKGVMLSGWLGHENELGEVFCHSDKRGCADGQEKWFKIKKIWPHNAWWYRKQEGWWGKEKVMRKLGWIPSELPKVNLLIICSMYSPLK